MAAKAIVFRPLPANVLPHHYELSLKLDLDNFEFEGKQSIYVKVNCDFLNEFIVFRIKLILM